VVAALLLLGAAVAPSAADAKPPPGYIQVDSAAFDAPAGLQVRGSVECPFPLVPLGGGPFVSEVSPLASVNSSFPVDTGWIADVNNGTSVDVTFTVSVVCARRPRHYAIVQSTSVDDPAAQQAVATAQCPIGTHPFGGGALSSSTSPAVSIGTSVIDGNGWLAAENNLSAADERISAFAVCGRLRGYRVVEGTSILVPADSQAESAAGCPRRSFVIGGGTSSISDSLGENLNSSTVDIHSWISFVNNLTSVSVPASTTVICAGGA
jgi:hypothetical protein